VWDLLQDPAVLAKALPGTERLALTAEDQYVGIMKVNIGPMTAAKFDVNVTLKDKIPPHRMALQIEGKGPVGFTRGTATVVLEPADDDTKTVMQYASDVHVGGRIASVGQRLLESVSKMMMRQALDALERELAARLSADTPQP
jgi:carbon monoxide dehydrogenase subunit G